MGLRTGTPDAEATITTRSARLDPDSRVGGRRSSSEDRRPSFCARASAIDRPSRAPATHWSQQCRIHAARPSGVPPAKPRAASRYAAPARRCPTSGTASPRGSSPEPIAASRAAARATTPFADANGSSASSSPCTTATSTGAGRRRPARRPARRAARAAPRRPRRRPGAAQLGLGATRSAAASTCSRASACSGAVRHDAEQPTRLLGGAHRPGQHRVGDRRRPPGRQRPHRPAPPTPAPPAAPPPPRTPPTRVRFTGWLCSATTRVAGPSHGRRRRRAAPPAGPADRGSPGHAAIASEAARPPARTDGAPCDPAD